MKVFLRVKDWNKHYENNRTRRLKYMAWVPFPNKMDGYGYLELMDHEQGPAHFAVFILIVEIASKCEPRGLLQMEPGKPHTAHSCARKAHLPATLVRDACTRLLQPQIGWLEQVDEAGEVIPIAPKGALWGQDSAPIAPKGARSVHTNGRERKGTEGNGTPPPPPRPAGDGGGDDEILNPYPRLRNIPKSNEYRQAIIDLVTPLHRRWREQVLAHAADNLGRPGVRNPGAYAADLIRKQIAKGDPDTVDRVLETQGPTPKGPNASPKQIKQAFGEVVKAYDERNREEEPNEPPEDF